MVVRRRLLIGGLALMLIAGLGGMVGCASTDSNSPDPGTEGTPTTTSARADYLISIADVAAAPDSSVLLDARAPEAYAAGHLPGAINAPWQPLASVGTGAPGDANWGTLLSASEIAAKLGELGVDTSKPIVAYTGPTGWGEVRSVIAALGLMRI
jgi:thiosulfate/3-mercaptopyruvate sulfurtransferase